MTTLSKIIFANHTESNQSRVQTLGYISALVLCSLGILLCTYLVYLSVNTDAGHFCELFGSDCTSVIRSDFGQLGEISVASLGLGYFVFHFSFLLALKNKIIRSHAGNVCTCGFGLIGLAFSIYCIYILAAVLKLTCIACYAVHAVNLLLFGVYVLLFYRISPPSENNRPHPSVRETGMVRIGAFSLLLAINFILAANLLDTRQQLSVERHKTVNNLLYYRFLYDTAKPNHFTIEPQDSVFGEKGIAVHQIILLFKDGCLYCKKAKEKLTATVEKHELSVYLVLKNASSMSPVKLKDLNVARLPAVFIDGKLAEGWELPGFLDPFLEDCGC